MSKRSESTSRGDSLDSAMTSLKVAVRVRPLNDKEINLGSKIVVDVLGNDIVITDLKVPEHQGYDHRSRVHRFAFDYTFSSVDPASEDNASQATVFEKFGRVVLQALLEGYNCCVIAYGQSGSGKTYTMMGMKDEEGLTPRICEGLLMKLEDEAKQNISFAVNISYMEIYNEQVYDLLQKSDERQNHNKPRLRVREHPVHGPFVEGLSTHVLKSRDNIYQLISEGNNNRVKAATYIHEKSSRSHAVFTVHCSQACLDESQPKEVVSKLQLVDLAGSEKAGHEFCQSRLKEGANINKSLVTLGNVISALVELSQRLQNGSSKFGQQLFVPYRDSQLTWLMKDSLGGNSYTFMLAAVSPSKECHSETLSTLRYAQRAKSILTIPVVNEDPATKIIRNLRLEVNKLKSLLTNADALSKNAVMKPLPNVLHLNSIMKTSEKKVNHLTRCWLQKWLQTYNSVVKKTNFLKGEYSDINKGTIDIPQSKKVEELPTERTDTMLSDCNINFSVRTAPPGNLSSLKTGDSDILLSEKSSSVSSECIILPNEIIFYSKGKKSNKCENYFTSCKPNFKSSSLNHVDDTDHECIISADKDAKGFSCPTIQFHCRPTTDISLCNTVSKSLPILNYQCIPIPPVHNQISIHNSTFSYFSLPKDLEALPESIKSTVETEKYFDVQKCDERINFEKACKEKDICNSAELLPNVNHCKDHSTHRTNTEAKRSLNSDKFLEQEVRNNTNKDYVSIFDHNMHIQTDNESLCAYKKSHDNRCINDFCASDNFGNSRIISNNEKYSGEDIQFNDSVTEESDNFVKLLNQIQDGSVETISHCFQRKDSDILSLLSLSSNDYPPFHSLDDFFDEESMGVPDGTDSVDTDILSENKEQCTTRSWSEAYSSSNVTDESESSDAESEFDYLDFTKCSVKTYPILGMCSDSFITTPANGHQNFQNSKFLRQTNHYKENLLSIPEDRTIPQSLTSLDTSVPHVVKSLDQAENDSIDTNYIAATRDGMNLVSENVVYDVKIPCEFPPLMCNDIKNQRNGNSPLLCSESLAIDPRHKVNNHEQRNYLNCLHDLNEVECGAKISDKRKGESFMPYPQESPVLQKRLCNSDGILKALTNDKEKYYSKSYNTIYVDSDECSISPKFYDGNENKENDVPYQNIMNNDSHEKKLLTNKNSVSNFLDFSVQDLLDMINDKGITQHKALFTERVYPEGEEEKFFNENSIPDEIQKFIDSTEITDANKLAGELLKTKMPQCPSSATCTLTSNDSIWNDHNILNKSFKSDTEGESYTHCDEKPKQQVLEAVVFGLDNAIPHSLKHQEQKLLFMTNNVINTKQSNSITTNAHLTKDNAAYKVNNVPHSDVTGAENINDHQENKNIMPLKDLHTAVQEVHCEKENALEFFTFNGYQESSLDPISDENYYLDNAGDLICKAKKSSDSQQINVGNDSRFMSKEFIFPKNSVELDSELLSSHLQNFVTVSPSNSVNDSNSQTNILTDFNTSGNLNITSLTPIQEEAIDDDVTSDISEDDSPNISFQFDSLERPKNMLLTKNGFASIGPICKTDATVDDKENTEELHESKKLTNMLSDVPKSFYNKNTEFPGKMCTITRKEVQNLELSNSDFNCTSSIKISNENLNSKSTSDFSSPLGVEEGSIKSASGTLYEVTSQFQFPDSLKNEDFINSENTDTCTVPDEINKNVELFNKDVDLKNSHFEEVDNLPNQVYSWDSSSPSTSSDSITFVFVGKENKDATLDTNSRSVQSSLFSSVSLDSLEKSSIHQNQAQCISPRTLSIDSLVAEELLFQLRNNFPIPQPTSKAKSCANNKCQTNNTVLVDQTSTPKKTNFAATSQLNCNQHLKMYRHVHCNMENHLFSQDGTGNLEINKCKDKNISLDVDRNRTVLSSPNTFPSGSYTENVGNNQFQNSSDKYSSASMESNDDIPELSYSYLRTSDPNKPKIDKNVHSSISDDCIKENQVNDSVFTGLQNYNLEKGNVFNTCASNSAKLSHYNCIDFRSHYSCNFLSNNSNAVLIDDRIVPSTKSSEHLDMNNYSDIQNQTCSPENICYNKEISCGEYVKNDHHNELFAVKELTEENLKMFNSELEENLEEIVIVPPPSTFDVSEDNGFSMISNSSSLSFVHHPSETTGNVFSKGTQTDQTTENEHNRLCEKEAVSDSGSTDLIERMMDLMVETLKLMKEQYCKSPKKPRSKPKRKLHFSSDSDKDMPHQKTAAMILPATSKHRKYLSEERSTDSKVAKYLQTVLPASNDYDLGNFNHSLLDSELLYHSQKNANEKFLNMKNKVNHDDPRIGCSAAKKPNFYTLPFDFRMCKYQCKKPPNASKFTKADTISQTSVDCLTDKTRNSYFINNEFNNLSAFDSTSATEHKLSALNEMFSLKQNQPKLTNSKNYLKHLIDVRRKVVQSTTGPLNNNENVNLENDVTDPLKSPSSSSEGYLSSVSSKGPFRQLSEISTDSQECSHIAEHLVSKQSFLKHNVRPLDFSSPCYRDVDASPDTRWLNTSADSGAFFLDSPGTEKKTNLDEYPNIAPHGNDFMGAASSVACTSSKMLETKKRSPLRGSNIIDSKKEENVPSSSGIKPQHETKKSSKRHSGNDFAPGFRDLDEIGENYFDISLREPFDSSTNSDSSFCDRRPLRNKNSPRLSKNSPRLKKRLSSQELQKLMESIESDRRLLRQIQHNHVFDRKYSPSISSLEDFDLFYQDCYKSLPSAPVYLNSSVSHDV